MDGLLYYYIYDKILYICVTAYDPLLSNTKEDHVICGHRPLYFFFGGQ